MFENKNWNQLFKTITYITGLLVMYLIFNYLSVYLFPFILALLFAYIFNPIVKLIQFKLKFKNRVLSVISFFILMGLIVFSLFYFVGPLIIKEISSSSELIYHYLEKSSDNPNSFINLILSKFQKIFNKDLIENLVNQTNIQKYGEDFALIVWNLFVRVFGIFESFFILITFSLYLLFILIYYNEFSENWRRIIPPMYRRTAVMLFADLENSMKIYFRGQSKIVILLCILFSVGFKIINLPLAILLGVITGLVNFVPYLQLAMIPPALILMSIESLEHGESFWLGTLFVLSVFGVVQLIQDTILVPKIMGDETGLNPAIILLSLSIFGGLFGIIGMIVALPVTTVLIKYYKTYILKE